MGFSEKNPFADNESFECGVSFLPQPKRIDVFLAERLKLRCSRAEIQALLKSGQIFLNGKPVKPSAIVREDDIIRGTLNVPQKGLPLKPEKIPLSVVYEDDNLLVVDKAVGMVVHPGAAAKKGTLVHALLGRGTSLSAVSGSADRPGIVHRLDKDTSGLLIVAKNNRAHRGLQEQFESRTVTKIYTALVRGRVDFEEGHVGESLSRDSKVRRKMAVARQGQGKEAFTRYRTLRRFAHSTLLEVRILTGRTHQIRVHLSHLGHPVLGDKLYGKKENALRPRVPTRGTSVGAAECPVISRPQSVDRGTSVGAAECPVISRPQSVDRGTSVGAAECPVISRLCLHASKIEFLHPKTGKIMRFESPLPPDFEAVLESQKRELPK